MSALATNQSQMRPKIFSGSPKKKAACRSSAKRKGGTRPGAVSTCHATKTSTSSVSCQARRLPRRGLMKRHMSLIRSGRELLLVALEDFLAQHVPDGFVQLDEARRRAHLGHVTRTLDVDAE